MPNSIIVRNSPAPKAIINYQCSLNIRQLSEKQSRQSLKDDLNNEWSSFTVHSTSVSALRSPQPFRNGIDNDGVTHSNDNNSNNNSNNDHTCGSASRTSDSPLSVDFVAFKAGKDGNDSESGSRSRKNGGSSKTSGQSSTTGGCCGRHDDMTNGKMIIPHTPGINVDYKVLVGKSTFAKMHHVVGCLI